MPHEPPPNRINLNNVSQHNTSHISTVLAPTPRSRAYLTLSTEVPMATAKVFWPGNSQAVQLPKEFCLTSDEVEIFRRGDEIVLREKPQTLARAFGLLGELPDGKRADTLPQEREGL
jgi:antitoxin VapB